MATIPVSKSHGFEIINLDKPRPFWQTPKKTLALSIIFAGLTLLLSSSTQILGQHHLFVKSPLPTKPGPVYAQDLPTLTPSPTATPTPMTVFIPKRVITPAPTTAPSPILRSQPSAINHQSSTINTDPVTYLLSLINQTRATVNSPAIASLDPTLSACALAHSKAMAARYAANPQGPPLFHDLQNDACVTATKKGENVGMATGNGTTPLDLIHNMMVAEKDNPTADPPPNHYTIMIDPSYTRLGIG
ncbi:MAG: CAP domain-containing protein, partial [Candidatus Saccharimonadales bacterium]